MTESAAYSEEWLAAEALNGGRFTLTGDVFEIREQFNGFFAAIKNMLPPPDYEVQKFDQKTPEGVDVRIYKPVDLPPTAPTGLYIHSGGWSCGSIEHEDHICRELAKDVPCQVVSVEYKLAPEHPFPAALDDCVAAWQWMTHNEDLKADKYFITGGSAGGNLAITTTLRLLEIPDENIGPSYLAALCPGTCMVMAMGSLPADLRQYENPHAYEDSAAISKDVLVTCGAAYTGQESPSNPLISPIFHPNLAKLPPVYLTTSDKDPASDEARMFHHKLVSLNVPVTLNEYNGFPHFFHALPMLKMTKKFNADLSKAIRDNCS